MVIYAASNGYLDEVDADDVPDWERQFRDHMRDSHSEILESIREEQKISDETEKELKEILERFN